MLTVVPFQVGDLVFAVKYLDRTSPILWDTPDGATPKKTFGHKVGIWLPGTHGIIVKLLQNAGPIDRCKMQIVSSGVVGWVWALHAKRICGVC